MADEMVKQILAGASLRCVMRPNDEIPSNRPLHDECFDLPHIIIDGEKFSAICAKDIVTRPGIDRPIVFYYTSYRDLFGAFAPVQVEPVLVGAGATLTMSLSTRKRYSEFRWLVHGKWEKVWDSQGVMVMESVRSAVLRAASMKVVFLDEENVWNIHPVILPQVACDGKSFLLQTAYIAYPQVFRDVDEIENFIDRDEKIRSYLDDERMIDSGLMEVKGSCPFHAFYHICADGSYRSWYDLARGGGARRYRHLMVFAEKIISEGQ